MKIKTDNVPADCDYLTAGEIYKATESTYKGCFYITADEGSEMLIYINGVSGANGEPWQIVEDEPFDMNGHTPSDSEVLNFEYGERDVQINMADGSRPALLSKADIIALAKAMGVTVGDL